MKICIFTADSNGSFPVPAVKDGAVQILIEHLIEENSNHKSCDLTVVSFYDKEAENKAKKYKNVNFIWITVPSLIKFLDRCIFLFFNKILKKRRANSYKTVLSLLYYIKKSSRILKRNYYDKVVLENNIPLALIIKKSKYNGQFFYHLHNIPRVNMNCKDIFKKCNGYICVSNYVGKEITSDENPIGPIDNNKVKTLYNCIDTKKFYINKDISFLNDIKNKYNIGPKDKILLFVGRLSEEKGIDKVLEALKLIKNEDFKLLVVGASMHYSNHKDEFQKKLRSLLDEELEKKVCFTGYIKQEELPKYYNIADIAILPSMWEEPAGLVMIEALCCGVDLITTNSGGIPEYVSDYAILLDKNDQIANNMAKEIKKLLHSKSSKEKNNINEINSRFSSEGYMERFVETINDFSN